MGIYSSLNLMYKIGLGKDIHRLKRGLPLILGGVKIPFKMGLVAHSDGDVVFHSIVDAILGALSKKDIGHYYPNNEINLNRDSGDYLIDMNNLLEKENYKISNIDITIECEKPMLNIYIDDMKNNISKYLNIENTQISIKACTNEKIGPIGRNLAIQSTCIILIYKNI